MNFIKKSIGFTNKFFKENVLKYAFLVAIIFFVFGIIAFCVMRFLPDESLEEVYLVIGEIFADKEEVMNADGTLSFWGILFNNLRACVFTGILGLIPFLFIPIVSVVFNSVIVSGLLAVVSVFTDENVIMMFIKYILPHGIFEIPAIIIGGAIGAKLCAFICRKIFGKAKDERLVDHIKGCIGVFVLYVIPLLIIAAFIETVVLDVIYL